MVGDETDGADFSNPAWVRASVHPGDRDAVLAHFYGGARDEGGGILAFRAAFVAEDIGAEGVPKLEGAKEEDRNGVEEVTPKAWRLLVSERTIFTLPVTSSAALSDVSGGELRVFAVREAVPGSAPVVSNLSSSLVQNSPTAPSDGISDLGGKPQHTYQRSYPDKPSCIHSASPDPVVIKRSESSVPEGSLHGEAPQATQDELPPAKTLEIEPLPIENPSVLKPESGLRADPWMVVPLKFKQCEPVSPRVGQKRARPSEANGEDEDDGGDSRDGVGHDSLLLRDMRAAKRSREDSLKWRMEASDGLGTNEDVMESHPREISSEFFSAPPPPSISTPDAPRGFHYYHSHHQHHLVQNISISSLSPSSIRPATSLSMIRRTSLPTLTTPRKEDPLALLPPLPPPLAPLAPLASLGRQSMLRSPANAVGGPVLPEFADDVSNLAGAMQGPEEKSGVVVDAAPKQRRFSVPAGMRASLPTVEKVIARGRKDGSEPPLSADSRTTDPASPSGQISIFDPRRVLTSVARSLKDEATKSGCIIRLCFPVEKLLFCGSEAMLGRAAYGLVRMFLVAFAERRVRLAKPNPDMSVRGLGIAPITVEVDVLKRSDLVGSIALTMRILVHCPEPEDCKGVILPWVSGSMEDNGREDVGERMEAIKLALRGGPGARSLDTASSSSNSTATLTSGPAPATSVLEGEYLISPITKRSILCRHPTLETITGAGVAFLLTSVEDMPLDELDEMIHGFSATGGDTSRSFSSWLGSMASTLINSPAAVVGVVDRSVEGFGSGKGKKSGEESSEIASAVRGAFDPERRGMPGRRWGPAGRVLVVEDNIINQTILKRILLQANVAAEVASDGFTALRLLTPQLSRTPSDIPFDLILMDVQLPGMDGITCTRRIREIERGLGVVVPPQPGGVKKEGRRRVTIVGVSGNATEESVRMGIESGMDAYLIKPYTKADILRIVYGE
ncbi:hypothetical protein HDU67_000521 [Dinochytrium kinnereticum]|nr:hypothetical protein HDU67_000521 [Dinochytrium kinnereticum]